MPLILHVQFDVPKKKKKKKNTQLFSNNTSMSICFHGPLAMKSQSYVLTSYEEMHNNTRYVINEGYVFVI